MASVASSRTLKCSSSTAVKKEPLHVKVKRESVSRKRLPVRTAYDTRFHGLECPLSSHFSFDPEAPEEFERFLKYARTYGIHDHNQYVAVRNVTFIYRDRDGKEVANFKQRVLVAPDIERIERFVIVCEPRF